MRPTLRLTLAADDGEEFMGVGLVRLLKRVDQFSSIRRAAADMKLSYVKALRILNRLEEHAGQPVLVRSRGGADRGGASLTPFGRALAAAYEDYYQEVDECAKRRFGSFEEAVARARTERSHE